GDVFVLEDHLAVAAAPPRVECAQRLAAEAALDAGIPERPEHDAVERAAAAERDRPRRRAEVGDDAGQHLIAFLPVAADDVERQTRTLTPGRRAVERN